VLSEVAPRIKQLRSQAALYQDAPVDCALVRETIALLQSLLPVYPDADKQAQVEMAREHNARADREAIERDRVVGVLDAWAAAKAASHETCWNGRYWVCRGWVSGTEAWNGDGFVGDDAHAARAAAAKAIEAGEV
jgi:hypothetical protein